MSVTQTQATTGVGAPGVERRAHPRYGLRLPATLEAGGAVRPGALRDFCLGGLYLSLEGAWRPTVGAEVAVRLELPAGGTVSFRARVARRDAHGVGLALLDPDPAALRRLLELARAAPSPRGEDAPPPDPALRREALALVRQRLKDLVATLGLELAGAAREALLEAVREASRPERAQALLEAADRLGGAAEALQRRFQDRLLAVQVAGDEGPPAGEGLEEGELRLLDEDALEGWLAATELAARVETRHGLALGELEQRIRTLLGPGEEPPVLNPRPYAQALLQALDETLAALGSPSEEVVLRCRQATGEVLERRLGACYEALNGELARRGVRYRLRPTAPPSGRRPTDEASPHQNRRRCEDLLEVADHLGALLRSLRPGASEAGPPASGAPPARREEVAALLERLEAEGQLQPALLVQRLRRLLADGDGAPRSLPPREARILEVGGQLLEQLEQDESLPRAALPWVRRLELPLLRLALEDPSVLTDREHPAWAVMDGLGRLDLDDALTLGALRREVEGALEQLQAEAADPRALRRSLERLRQRLETLLRIHQQAYEANLAEVVAACEAGRRELLAVTRAGTETDAEGTPGEAATEAGRRRARRLRRGQWLLAKRLEAGPPQRLRLAWISRDQDRFVLVDGKGLHATTLDLEAMARALERGCIRPLETDEAPLLDRIQHGLLQAMHRRLLHAITHDPLTGLAHRKEFLRRLHQALGEGDGGGRAGEALVHLDLGRLETANAVLGYEATDRILAQVGQVLRRWLAADEPVGRIGAHAFAALLRRCPPERALERARELVEACTRACRLDGAPAPGLTPRAGLALVEPGECDAAALLEAAETACRAAWEAGAPVQVFHLDDARIRERRRMAALLAQVDRALEEGRLGLRWQPILPLTDPSLPRHGELLLSVADEHGRPIPPQDFVLAAERHGRMPAIDRWVVREALAWLARHRERAAALGTVGINLSGASVGDETFLAFLMRQVEKLRPPMDRVCFEITETAGIASLSDAGHFIEELKRTGCSFALDDFGSGTSSYAYLKQLPVDLLKIDGAFVREMDRHPEDEAVVRSITEIAHFLGKRVVAEHVEGEGVLERLRAIGVDYGQGWALGKPRPLEACLEEAGPSAEGPLSRAAPAS